MVELARSDRSHHHRSHHQAGFFASGTHSHLQASVAGHSNCQTQACSLGSHAASRAGSHSCFSQASSSSRPAPSHFAASASPSSCGARPTLTVTSRPLARSAATVTWRRRARSDRTHHPPPALWFGLHESSSSTLVALASVSRRLHPACRLRSQLHDDHLQARSLASRSDHHPAGPLARISQSPAAPFHLWHTDRTHNHASVLRLRPQPAAPSSLDPLSATIVLQPSDSDCRQRCPPVCSRSHLSEIIMSRPACSDRSPIMIISRPAPLHLAVTTSPLPSCGTRIALGLQPAQSGVG